MKRRVLGANTATYSYLANSPLVSQIAFQQNGTNRMTTTKSYDNLNRLTQISWFIRQVCTWIHEVPEALE